MKKLLALFLLLPLGICGQTWQQTNGPYGVTVYSIVADSSDHLFISTAKGTYRSMDNGDTWIPMPIGIPANSIDAIAVAPNGHLFALGDSLYKSMDDGTTWSAWDNLPPFAITRCLTVDSAGVLFVGSYSGMYRSDDDGDTWSFTPVSLQQIDVITDGPGDTLYAANDNIFDGGLVRSADGGDTWAWLYTGSPNQSTRVLGVNADGHVFAATNGLYRSTNGGVNWTELDLGTPDDVTCIAWNSVGEMFVSTYGSGVLRSLDNGTTWGPVNPGLYSWYLAALAVNNTDHLFAGTLGGIFRSTDGGASWSGNDLGIISTNVTAVQTNAGNDYFAAVYGVGVFRSQDQGNTWQVATAGLEGTIIGPLAVNSSGHLFLGTGYNYERGGVYRSIDNGDTWIKVTDSTVININALAINSMGYIYAGCAVYPNLQKVLRSTDNGDTWIDVSNGLACVPNQSLAVDTNDMVLASAFYCPNGLYTSVNNGITWSASTNGLWNAGDFRHLAVGPANVLFAASMSPSLQVFRSTNNAVSWEPINNGLSDPWVQALACPSIPGLVLLGSNTGAFITGTDGDQWWPCNDGLTNTNVGALAFDQNGVALAGTQGGGVFRAVVPVGIAEVRSHGALLQQNQPNPCATSTTIRYDLTSTARVTLKLLDAQSREVAVLRNSNEAPGMKTVEVDVNSLESGIYFYRLSVDGRQVTRRMVVAR